MAGFAGCLFVRGRILGVECAEAVAVAIVVTVVLSLLPRTWQLPGGLLLAWSGFLLALASSARRRRPRER